MSSSILTASSLSVHQLPERHQQQPQHNLFNDNSNYSPRSLTMVKPPRYQETCRKTSSSSAGDRVNQAGAWDAADANRQQHQPHIHQLTANSLRRNQTNCSNPISNSNNTHSKKQQTVASINLNKQSQTEVKPKNSTSDKWLLHHQQQHPKQHYNNNGIKGHIHHNSYYPNARKDDDGDATNDDTNNNSLALQQEANRWQRRFVNFFQIYFVVMFLLALTYAIYHFANKQQQPNFYRLNSNGESSMLTTNGLLNKQQQQQYLTIGDNPNEAGEKQLEVILENASAKQLELEQKLQLMQKYIELIAVDLQDTKERLREREKCHCSRTCQFNGTQHADGASWQHQCDTCSCQSGKVNCAPIKCPKPACDEPQQVAGQCCPVCLKKCKYNQTSLKHGQTFRPNESPSKECTCFDGLIKCAPTKLNVKSSRSNPSNNNSNNQQQKQRQNKQAVASPSISSNSPASSPAA